MNSNPASPILFLAFLVLSIIAIAGGKPAKWKLYNLLIILGCVALGLAGGYMLGVTSGNMKLGADLAVSFLLIFGAAGAYVCMRRNMKRNKALPGAPEI